MARLLSLLGRNGSFAWQLGALAVAAVALSALCGWAWGSAAAMGCALCGVVSCALFCLFSKRRYDEVSRLADQVSAVVEQGRRLDLADYREGDVAVLGNQVAKMVAQLARTTEQLDREKRMMGDWMADISHQIRTPLTALSLTASAIERADGPEERKALVRQLETRVDQLSWLVTALLRLAKLDAAALPLERRPVALDSLFDEALSPLVIAFDLRGVEARVDCQPGAGFLGDARWTAEALSNVLKNCLEHVGEGGVIRLVGREDAVACRIRVVDDGPGIAAKDLPHVFERFYRGAHPSDAAPERPDAFNDGFGIGLSLAQALVSAQGGTLRASNEPGEGARFDFTFPKMNV